MGKKLNLLTFVLALVAFGTAAYVYKGDDVLAKLFGASSPGVAKGQMFFGAPGPPVGGEIFLKSALRSRGAVAGTGMLPGEIIVKFKPGVSGKDVRRLNRRLGASVLSVSRRGGFMRLRVPRGRTVEEAVGIYERLPQVEYAEPNHIATALFVPNDSYYSYQWHLDNPTYGGIHMEPAWDIRTGSPGVVVAVVDTGVAYENYRGFQMAPDFAETSFVAGYDFVNNDSHPNDDEGHGTHVAGTVAQSTNNSLGVAGVAFNASIMPVKVLDSRGFGSHADVAEGIYFAADGGADVINLSLGGPPSSTLRDALAYAYNRGVAILCASGNEYEEGNAPSYPAAYDAYCIAVGATRYDEQRAYYSNTGNYVDISAPGGDITVDQNNDGYGDGVLQQSFGSSPKDFGYWFYQGTSMATPHVSGVAALLLARGITGPSNVRDALESTAEDKGPPGWDPEYGWGIVDAYAALNYAPGPVHDIALTDIVAPGWALKGDVFTVMVTVENQGTLSDAATVTLSDATDGRAIGTQSVNLPPGGSAVLGFDWDTVLSSIGTHVLRADAEVIGGEAETEDNSISTAVDIRNPSHDVAVTALDAPFEAPRGEVVTVYVTVDNEGTFAEITTVTLDDTTDSATLGVQEVALEAGASRVLNFSWSTAGASLGEHVLRAEASAVAAESDTADNSLTNTASVVDPLAAASLHVAGIEVELKKKGRAYDAAAIISVAGPSGAPVEGATVYGEWKLNGTVVQSDTGDSNASGSAKLSSGRVSAGPGDIFVITVTDIARDGYAYDSAANAETSGSVTVP